MTIAMFDSVGEACSRLVTVRYSTSFASAIKLLHTDLRTPVFNIYAFVRFADEIVDTLHRDDQRQLLEQFKRETFEAIDRGISLNPVLNSFQKTVNAFRIDHGLIHAFFRSMECDLVKATHNEESYKEYIYGSAEVVGLMCLYVFCEGDEKLYRQLKQCAQALGAAFQKVNFLRDIRADHHELSRVYFPGCDFNNFTRAHKEEIEQDIEEDFKHAWEGIVRLPVKARFGVYVAYKYYYSLFRKIKSAGPKHILQKRFRVPDYHKACILLRATVKNGLGLI